MTFDKSVEDQVKVRTIRREIELEAKLSRHGAARWRRHVSRFNLNVSAAARVSGRGRFVSYLLLMLRVEIVSKFRCK